MSDGIVREKYGASETFPLENGAEYYKSVDRSVIYTLADKEVVKITRLRLLSDPGYPYWDVSYCHGQLADGTIVPVLLDDGMLPKNGLSRALVEMAKRAGRYAKGIGLLDNISFCQ